jgi:hypothetical protein
MGVLSALGDLFQDVVSQHERRVPLSPDARHVAAAGL